MNNSELPRALELLIIREKHELIPVILKEADVDCWIIFVRETSANPDPIMPLVCGGDVVWESAFIFHLSKEGNFSKTAIVGNFDVDGEKKKKIWDNVIGYKEGISNELKLIIQQFRPLKIALNYSLDDVVSDGLSHGMYLKIASILSDDYDRFISAKPIIQAVRGRKTETELKLITKSCLLTEEINRRITKILTPGLQEIEIQKLFHEEMDKEEVKESWQRVSNPAVDAGPNKEFGHVGPSNLQTQLGHTLHNDFGIILQGYASDIQRMWFFGTKDNIPDEIQHGFNTVKTAIQKAANFIKPGVSGFSVDKIARDYVISQGYTEYAHALGHQVGRHAHDGGILLGPLWERYGDTPKGLVEENNVFTLELYVKTPHFGMVSLEEMIKITKNGCEFIIEPQKELIFISN